MRILICDDDTLIIEQLKKYIESYFESNHLKCPELVSFTSGEALLTDKGEKDIVFSGYRNAWHEWNLCWE